MTEELLNASQAAELLGISKASLYAYVSRGLLQSQSGPDRSHLYSRSQLESLKLRKARPRQAAQSALYWGLPSLESHISQISQGELFYRGRPALELAQNSTIEEVLELLWEGRPPALEEVDRRGLPTPGSQALYQWLCQQMHQDARAWDLRPVGVRRSGGRIFEAFRSQLPGPIERLRKPLILCADHELNASAFAARVAAGTGANPYAVVLAALATLSGPRHGGACDQVEALWQEALRLGSPREAIWQRMRRGDPVPGFGHRLYPQGDPRARAILQDCPQAQAWVEAGQELLQSYPSLDLALVALQLPPGCAFWIFASGRCLGWIAHALEQYADGRMIRPRAGP